MNAINDTGTNLVSAVYVSSASQALEPKHLRIMLTEIRHKNKARGITGILFYRNGEFLQVIEGEESEIDKLLTILKSDPRHRSMIILSRTSIQQREFGDWQMAFHDLSGPDLPDEDLPKLEGYSPFLEDSFTSQQFRDRLSLSRDVFVKFKEVCY